MQLRHGILGLMLPVALILLLVALRYDLIGKTMRRLRLYWNLHTPESAQANPLLASRLYAELLRQLERHGFARRAAQTPLEFAVSVQTLALAPAVSEFTRIYSTARYGGAPFDTPRLRPPLLPNCPAPRRPQQRFFAPLP